MKVWKVKATQKGWIYNRTVMPGYEFEVSEQLFSDRWMQKIGEASALPVEEAEEAVVSEEAEGEQKKAPAKRAAKKAKKGE